jgi:hypothetical protein
MKQENFDVTTPVLLNCGALKSDDKGIATATQAAQQALL